VNLLDLDLSGNAIRDLTPLTGLILLEELNLSDNGIVHITALTGLFNLNVVDLSDNEVTNILALVENDGIGIGDTIDLSGNPLDTSVGSPTREHLDALERRRLELTY